MNLSKRRTFLVGILTALVLSLLYWLFDSVLEYYRFERNLRFMLFQEPLSLLDSLILHVPQPALIDRLSFAVASVIGGILVSVYLHRWRETSDRFESYLAASPTGVFISDQDGVFTDVNLSATLMTGYQRQELVGMHMTEIVDPEWHERLYEGFQRAVSTGRANAELALLHHDGTRTYVIVNAVAMAGGSHLAMATPIDELRQAREHERHLIRVGQCLREASLAIAEASTPQEVADHACWCLIGTATYHAAWIALMDANKDVTYVAYCGGGDPGEFEGQLYGGRLPPCALQAMQESSVVVFDDPVIRCPDCPLADKAEGSAMTARIALGDRIAGVISVCVPSEYAHAGQEQHLLQELANDVGAALRRIELARDRSRAEQLREQYAHIVAASQDALCLVNRDYTYAVANATYARISGTTPEEIVGQTVGRVLGAEMFSSTIKSRIDRCLAGEPVLWERWMTLPGDGERYYQVSYSPVYGGNDRVDGVAVRLSDITELRETERQLVERSQQLDQIIEELPDAVVFSDMQRRITRVNQAFTKITGYAAEEAIGRSSEFMYANPADGERYGDERQSATSLQRQSLEVEFRGKDGRVIQGEMTGVVLRDPDGVPYGFLVLARDIGDRKAAEAERLAMEQQLRQAQKMEAVGQLAGGVAHDFNNLLQVIEGYVEFLLEALPHDSEELDYAQEIKTSAGRASMLTRQLLAFSRRQVLARVDLDLDELIQNLLRMLGRLIGEHISMAYSPSREALWVNADPGQVEQVLLNLCVNARDAMPDGGRIEIKTSRVSLDREFCQRHRWAQPGNYATFIVSDTGYGMDQVVLGQLFEPFFTTKEIGRGTGLGLATVYGIVQQHEGLIEVQSELGAGSLFRVYLPLAERIHGVEALPEPEPEPEPVVGGSEKILLAEDDPVVRRLTETLLRDAGYDVASVHDGVQAMAILDAQGSEFDLVVLDVVMPNASGRDVYEHYRQLYPHGKVLFMSGYSTGILGDDLSQRDGAGFLAKPFSAESLLRQVRALLE